MNGIVTAMKDGMNTTTQKTVHSNGWFSVVEETTGTKTMYRVAAGGMFLCGGGSATLEGALAFIASQKA